MNADAFRHLYDYHFAANRKIWDTHVAALTQEQFTQPTDYSVGSVRNQVVHMMNIDDRWFSGLRGIEVPGFLDPTLFTNREEIRAQWDTIEQNIRDYLAGLRDDQLFDQPFLQSDNDTIYRWQILIHVANHGTDHRAQLLALLHSLGLKTGPQDYVFYIYGRL
jgi:uncharacterized damage-inducible protein DinB